MQDHGVTDPEVIKSMIGGFPLFGDMLPSGNYEHADRPATIWQGDLLANSKWVRKKVLGSVRGSGNAGVDKEVYQSTI